jgi:hypothetical protein
MCKDFWKLGVLALKDWHPQWGRVEVLSLICLEGVRPISISGVLSFVARTLLSHLRTDQNIHCCHPSHTVKIGQAGCV